MTTEETRVEGASELMRELGLLVDGPSRWGSGIPSRGPGVFVVELPGGAESAPVDVVAVRRWIERVPAMLLDGERPAAQELTRWLGEMWLPGEPILFVGRSARAIGQRLAAIYATPLGDSQPTAAGHWLKTLAVQQELRVWWAETDAAEEYEDAILSAVASRNDGHAPFANRAPGGADPATAGLAGSLLAKGAPGSDQGSRAAIKRSAARRTTAEAVRKPRLKASTRPAPEPTLVSREGMEKLGAELDNLRTTVRPQVIARVKAAREFGDLKENGDYEYARKEQSFVEGRIQALEQMMRNAQVVDGSTPTETVRLGSTVVVESQGEELTFLLVGPAEADPKTGRISNASPVGGRLIGSRVGDEVTVTIPAGSVTYRVLEVR